MTQPTTAHRALLEQLGFECVFVPESTVSLPCPYFIRQQPLPRTQSDGEGATAVLTDGSGWSRWNDLTLREQWLLRFAGLTDNTKRTLAYFTTVH